MTKNKLSDLNDHLFCQLERLGDENLKEEDIEREVGRTEAIVSVSEKIIDNAKLSLDAAKLIAKHGGDFQQLLPAGSNKPKPKLIPDYKKEEIVEGG